MGKRLAAAVAAALLLSACTDDPPDVGFEGLPEASESPTPSPAASAEAPDEIDVTTTPDEITPEWVTAVVNTILAEYGEMGAEILATPVSNDPTLPAGFEDRLVELFGRQDNLDRKMQELMVLSTDSDARAELLPAARFGGLRFATEVVQVAQPYCLIAIGRLSRELAVPDGGPLDVLSAVSLSPSEATSSETNPTPWQLIDELPNTDPNGDPNPDSVMLEASLDDFGDALDNSCASNE